MRRRVPNASVLALALFLFTSSACQKPAPTPARDQIEAPSTLANTASSPPSAVVLAGTSCRGRDDCVSDQVCMQNVCRSRRASAAGEILTAAAVAQLEAGDVAGALHSFDEAAERYRAANAPYPPELVCGAANAALRGAASAEDRENAAKRADLCFRNSLPNDPSRAAVRLGLARLRYDGLDLALFDRPEPATRFFTQPPTRPTVDAIQVSLNLPDRDDSAYRALRDALHDTGATRAIAGCFVSDWETRHERSAEASLTISLTSRLRDMGSYDAFEAVVEVTPTVPVDNQFTNCVARDLTMALQPSPRVNHLISWHETFVLTARVQ